MAEFPHWQTALLRRLGVPTTKQNLQFLTAWQAHEGGTASNNPLNTTQPWQGASSYNSVGVRNYPTSQAGLEATIKTLRNGYYPAIIAALQSGNPSWNPQLGKNLSTWGTGSEWMGGYRSTPTAETPSTPVPVASEQPTVAPAGPSQAAQWKAGLLAGAWAANQQTLGVHTDPNSVYQMFLNAQAKQPGGLNAPVQQQAPTSTTRVTGGYPLGVRGKIIGVPNQGTHTLYGNWESDNAVDISAKVGTPVYAVASGVIGSRIGSLGSGDARLQGLRLHLEFPGNEAYYAHLSRIVVKPGQHVKAGQLLGYSGQANGSAHLHIALKNGDPRSLVG